MRGTRITRVYLLTRNWCPVYTGCQVEVCLAAFIAMYLIMYNENSWSSTAVNVTHSKTNRHNGGLAVPCNVSSGSFCDYSLLL